MGWVLARHLGPRGEDLEMTVHCSWEMAAQVTTNPLTQGHLPNDRKKSCCDDCLLGAEHYDRPLLTSLFLIIITPCKVGIVVPMFQVKELRLGEVKQLAPGHTGTGLDLNKVQGVIRHPPCVSHMAVPIPGSGDARMKKK